MLYNVVLISSVISMNPPHVPSQDLCLFIVPSVDSQVLGWCAELAPIGVGRVDHGAHSTQCSLSGQEGFLEEALVQLRPKRRGRTPVHKRCGNGGLSDRSLVVGGSWGEGPGEVGGGWCVIIFVVVISIS